MGPIVLTRHREVIGSRCAKEVKHNWIACRSCKSTTIRPGSTCEAIRVYVLSCCRDRAAGSDLYSSDFRAITTIATTFAPDIGVVATVGGWRLYHDSPEIAVKSPGRDRIGRRTGSWYVQGDRGASCVRLHACAAINRAVSMYISIKTHQTCAGCRA